MLRGIKIPPTRSLVVRESSIKRVHPKDGSRRGRTGRNLHEMIALSGTVSPLCAFHLRGGTPMKVFDHRPAEVRHVDSYPKPVRNNAPAWIAGVIVGAIIGIFAYESSHGTRAGIDTAPTRDVTQAPAPPASHPAKP